MGASLCSEHCDWRARPLPHLRTQPASPLTHPPLLPCHAQCYNGKAILYTSTPLTLPSGDQASLAGWGAWSFDGETFQGAAFPGTKGEVTIRFKPCSSGAELRFDNFMDVKDRARLNVLDIAFQRYPKTVFKEISGAFFDEGRARRWAKSRPIGREGRFEMWTGKSVSILMTSTGPHMQIDTKPKVMLKAMKLVDFIAQLTGKSSGAVSLTDCSHVYRKVSSAKIAWRIASSHSNRPYKLRGIDTVPCKDSMFPLNDTEEMSVFDYFTKKLNVPLHRPDLPCVLVGPAGDPHKIRLPLEICSFLSGQPAPVTPEIQQEQIKETAAPPSQRFQAIKDIHDDMVNEQKRGLDGTPAAFNMTMGDKLITASAEVLTSPKLLYKYRGTLTEVNVSKQRGDWNLRAQGGGGGDLAFIKGGKTDGCMCAGARTPLFSVHLC